MVLFKMGSIYYVPRPAIYPAEEDLEQELYTEGHGADLVGLCRRSAA